MNDLTVDDIKVLNAASDDFENLEQLYRSISLEFSSENYSLPGKQAFYWREATNAPSLADIANSVMKLLAIDFLEARNESGAKPEPGEDAKIVWEGWFHTTAAGRVALQKTLPAQK